MTFPNETLPKGRKQKTTALYDRFVNQGAVMGDSFGPKVNGPLTIFFIPAFSNAGILSKPIANLSSMLSNFGSSNS